MTTEEAKVRVTVTNMKTGETLTKTGRDTFESGNNQVSVRKQVLQTLADPNARNHTTNVTVKVNQQKGHHEVNFGLDLTPWLTDTGNREQDVYNAIQRLKSIGGVYLGKYPIYMWTDEDGDRTPLNFRFFVNYDSDKDGLVFVVKNGGGGGGHPLAELFGGSADTSNGTLTGTIRTRIADQNDLILESQTTTGRFEDSKKRFYLVENIASRQWTKNLGGVPVFKIQAAFDLEATYYTTTSFYFSESPDGTPVKLGTDVNDISED